MFLPKRNTGGFGAPLLLREVRGVHRDARMVEPFVPKPTGPSGVPFIEMLEYGGTQASTSGRPSGVPFIEMLEYPPLKKPL